MSKIALSNDRIRKFVEHVKAECKRAGAKCVITKGVYAILDGLRVSRSFSGDEHGNTATLAVARRAPLALETLVHEFAHFMQWDSKSPLWTSDKHQEWLLGDVELGTSGQNHHFRLARNVELDAERRAVRLIKKWKLPLNIKQYIKQANSYIYFYGYAKRNRVWCQIKGTYAVPAIIALMPNKFLKSSAYDTPPVGYDLLVSKHCCRTPKTKKK